jgi:hypothetical protein
MSKIYNTSGGYRKLHSFNFATIIHLGTISFCKRYLSWKDDPLGKTVGQMIGASRSGKQNIIEGSERAKTSSETEIKLTDVAKASLSELQGDLEDYLVQKGGIKEKMFSARLEARAEPDAPKCPQCGEQMRKRSSARGPFWGCSHYPQCKGVRQMAGGVTPAVVPLASGGHEVTASRQTGHGNQR